MSGQRRKRKKKKNVYVLNLAEVSLLLTYLSGKAAVRGHMTNKTNKTPSLHLGGHWLLSFISTLESSCQVKAKSHCGALSGGKATAKGTFSPF